jgi:CHAT domain-containing protein/tetratricopeptide (TPR) repeat protein
MKKIIFLFIVATFFCCSKGKTPQDDKAIDLSCRTLDTLSKSTIKDTLALRAGLVLAYKLGDLRSILVHDSLITIVSRKIGELLIADKKFQEARFYCEKGIRFGSRQWAFNAFPIAKLYSLLGVAYYKEENFETALIFFDSVKLTATDSVTLVLTTQNQIKVADCYKRLKNVKAAQYLYENSIPLAHKYLFGREKADFYNQYSYFQGEIKHFQQAIEAAQKSVKILSDLINGGKAGKLDSISYGNAYYYLAYAYQYAENYRASAQFYQKAMPIYKAVDAMEHYKRCLLNLGLIYRYDKRFAEAAQVLTEGIILLNKEKETDPNLMKKGKLFNNRSEVFMDTKEYKKALADQDSAIYYLTLYDKRASLTTLLMSNRKSLLSTYENKAKIYALYEENGSDTEGSLKALKYTHDIIKIADDIRADYFSDEAKLTLANDIKPALEKAISVCQKLYQKTKDKQYLEQAFGFVEYSRSMVLYENARLDNQLPPELKAENEALKKREAALIAKNNVEYLQEYLRLKRQFREKIKALNRNQLASVADVQKAIVEDNHTALIEFFVGDSSIFVFTLLHNSLQINELKKTKDFEKQIENLRLNITQATPLHHAEAFEVQSHRLYTYLLKKTLDSLSPTISQLIIAPDGVLNYLPFEVLIKKDPSVYAANLKDLGNLNNNKPSKDSSFIIHHSSFKNCDFLLRHYIVSYAYSANLLLEQKRKKTAQAPELFAGFASKYENKDTTFAIADVSRAVLTREGAYELKGAKEEVTTISDLVGGKAYLNEFATEESFKKEANQYKILHFAMHSLTDDKDPSLSKLLFTLTPKDTTNDNDLTAAELYATSLKADLAVLSACNTGFGTLNKGEGVMSLARAFTYAGVPSTVTSLWKVPDVETREIMVEFYKNLKKGMPKDAALHQAKLTYLDNTPESIAANPYFWAGFVPMGNMNALDLSEKGPLSIKGILAIILGILGMGFWFWKRKSTIK